MRYSQIPGKFALISNQSQTNKLVLGKRFYFYNVEEMKSAKRILALTSEFS